MAKRPDQSIVDEAIEFAISAAPPIQKCLLTMLARCGPAADTTAFDDTLVALLRDPETRGMATQLLRERTNARQHVRIDLLETLAAVRDVEYSSNNQIAITVFAGAARTESTRAAGFAGLFALATTGDANAAGGEIHKVVQDIPLGDSAARLFEVVGRVKDGWARQEIVAALLLDAKRCGDTARVTALVDHPNPSVAQAARYATRG